MSIRQISKYIVTLKNIILKETGHNLVLNQKKVLNLVQYDIR